MTKINIDLMLASVSSLPTLPVVAHRVGELVSDPGSDSKKIADTIKQDQSLCARVLTLANSAYYAVPGGVSDVRRAISYLGFNTVYQLVLTVSVFEALPAASNGAFDLKELWKHSLGTAIASEATGKQIGFAVPEELFTSGLLHDIGKVALASLSAKNLDEVVRIAKRDGRSFREVEREGGLPTHDDIGARLAAKWKLPGSIAAGIGYHHKLTDVSRAGLARGLHAVADVVALADVVCRRAGVGNGGDEVVPMPDPLLLERLNLTQAAVQKIQDEVPRTIERVRAFLDLLDSLS